jgi:high affinity Mn2+ porin
MRRSARALVAKCAAQGVAALTICALAGCAAIRLPGYSEPKTPSPAAAPGQKESIVSEPIQSRRTVSAPPTDDVRQLPIKYTATSDTALVGLLDPVGSATSSGDDDGKPEEAEKETEEAKAPEKAKHIWYSVHEQGTVVTQIHDQFHSPYIGPRSLLPREPAATSETATLYLDAKLWRGADIVFDPEIAGGRGFSGTAGIAGFPNGEITRVAVPEPTPYIARLLLRQTWELGGEQEKVEDAPNQIAGVRDVNRFTMVLGKFAAIDMFDTNRYSNDPRTQFLPWALMYNGAWDYPANVRGYDFGVAMELNTMFYALRYGIFGEPAVANGAAIDPHFLKANGQILELEERYWLADCPGKIHQWVYLNRAHMGDYRESVEAMPVDPDVTLTRSYRYKYGFGGNWEQELTPELGVFAKIGWNDGHTETWAFTAIDRTFALGMLLKGKRWKRPNDEVGLAGVVNGLARDHRDYLRAGGLDFIIGDGKLNYAPEQILGMYYNWQLVKGINVTADFQAVNHPAYNADRGPVVIGSLRFHFEH